MVLQILEHEFSDTDNKLWLVQWHSDDTPSNTWENHATLKDVEAFHRYCATHRLNAILPNEHPQFSASKPRTQRRTPEKFATPQAPPDALIEPAPEKRKRGDRRNTARQKQGTRTPTKAKRLNGGTVRRRRLVRRRNRTPHRDTAQQDDADIRTSALATLAQLDTMHATQEKDEERRMDALPATRRNPCGNLLLW